MSGVGGWSTASELNFIARIGTHSEQTRPRDVLLRGYIEAAEKRKRWGSIEPDVAIGYARAQLELMS